MLFSKEKEGWYLFKEVRPLPVVNTTIGDRKVVAITWLGNSKNFITDECEKNWVATCVKRTKKKRSKQKGRKY